jgi:hypothetical protein
MRIPVILELLPKLFEKREPVLLVAGPGVGKSDLTRQAADKAKADLIITHPVVSDPVDFKGLPFLVSSGKDAQARFLPIGHMRQLVDATRPTVCFLDDLGQAPPATQAAAMQLLLARSLDEHKISDHVTFVAATNRKEDRAGVTGILEPVKGRFTTILYVDPNVDDWTKWALSHGMPHELVGFINFKPSQLNAFQATAELKNSPTPRTVAAVGRLMKMALSEEVTREAITGAAGEGFMAELFAYLEVYKDLPDLADYFKRPDDTPIPAKSKLGARHAVVAGLAHTVTKDKMDAFVTVMERFTDAQEFAVMGMRMAISKDQSLSNTRACARWISKNNKIFHM